MTIIYPEATSAQGNIKLTLATAVATLTAPDLSGEISAVTSLDISCFVVGNFNPEVQINTGNAPSRLCTVVELPVEGRTQFSPITVEYVYNPQEASGTDDNKAKTFLVRGTEFFALERRGLDAQATAWAAGQYSRTWKFRAGYQNLVQSGDDEFAIFIVRQQWFPLIEPVAGLVVA